MALGLTMMTKGPVGAVWVIAPLIIMAALTRRHALRNIGGLVLCTLIGAAIMVPWFVHVADLQTVAVSTLAEEYKPVDTDQFRPLYYYAAIIALVFPWTFWWMASIFHPLKKENRTATNLFPLLWFGVCFLFLCAWPMRHQRYLVPLLPAAGLMTAIYLDQRIAQRREHSGPHWMLIVFWTLATVITLVLPTYIILEPWLLSIHAVDEAQFAAINLPGGLAAGAILLLMCACGMISAQTRLTQKAYVYIATWMIILSTLVYYGYSLAGHQSYEYRQNAIRYASLSGSQPAYYLYQDELADPPRPAIGFTIYSLKITRPISLAEVQRKIDRNESFSLLIETNSPEFLDLHRHGLFGGRFEDDDHFWYLLNISAQEP